MSTYMYFLYETYMSFPYGNARLLAGRPIIRRDATTDWVNTKQ